MPWTRTTRGSNTTQRKSARTYTSRKNNGLGMSQASWRRMVINDALEEADELEAEFQARKRAREEEEEEAPASASSASISASNASTSMSKEKENAATVASVLPPAKRQKVTRASKPTSVWTPYEGSASTTTSTRTTRSATESASATAAAAPPRYSYTAPSQHTSAIPPRHGPTATSFSSAHPTHQDMKAIPDALKPKIPVLFPEVFDPVLYAKFAAMYKAGLLPGYPPAGAGGTTAGGSAAAPAAGGAASATVPVTSQPASST
ncbi:uncharacterized protein SCHCODRAFT_02637386 [Schizophyllum commune H4-8]|uniref:Expressed protein n=1 Tax=Schizophyllum commune (strain H4-8 / FGSC 9210) TaxID=578458 RepID=D8QDK6_SCHCM|nr:uncharacterized protein SCHCODRAFT_02637386 [Schizophyllum commune H4-8]KAI5888682.1 hypothetical protein SCHCODRAFT_02637386 [Schizophyllum commune H4-8]